MMIVFSIFVFLFGLCIGSFLNVFILRYNTGQSIISGSSRCFSCGKRLKWYELIPVLSFLFQKGRCRRCKSKISWQYPIIEILTGIIFLLIFLFNYGQIPIFKIFYFWIIFSLLIIISIYDLRHQIIPDNLVYAFDILAFLNLFWGYKLEIGNWNFLSGLLTGAIFFIFFGLMWLISNGQWMGLGDAKLSLGIGWLLGIKEGIVALLLSFWIGGLVGIFLLFFLKKRYNLKSSVPFGPFLALGTIISFLWTKNFF